jgi:tetratricopeptide (TPR) repeat protein
MSGKKERRGYPLWLAVVIIFVVALSALTLYLLDGGVEPPSGPLLALATESADEPRAETAEAETAAQPEPGAEPVAEADPVEALAPTAPAPAPAVVIRDTIDPRLAAARAAAARKDWAEADRLYGELLRAPGADPELFVERARMLSWAGDYAGAAAAIAAAGALAPMRPEWSLERARYLWWAGSFPEAEVEVGSYLRERPADPEALGLQFRVRQSMSPSVAAARGWLAEQETPFTHLWLARAYAREERAAESLSHYRAATASGVLPDSVLLEWASMALTADSPRVAATALETFLRGAPDADPELRLRLARAYAWSDLTEPAIGAYSELLAANDDPQLRFERAQLYAWSGELPTARHELLLVQERLPEHAPTARLLGDVAHWQGDLPAAVAHYRRAYELAPDDELLWTLQQAERDQMVALAEVASGWARPSDRWRVVVDGFGDSQKFYWFSTLAAARFGGNERSLEIMAHQDLADGLRRTGGRFRSFGGGARLEGRTRLAGAWTGRAGFGVRHFGDVGTFPVWGAGIDWLGGEAGEFSLSYERQPAVRGALTAASLGAEVTADALRLAAHRPFGLWSLGSELTLERLRSDLGTTDRALGSLVLGRQVVPGLTASAGLRLVATSGASPELVDWGTLYWTPRYFITPLLQLSHYSPLGERWEMGLRLGAGYSFLEERGLLGARYDRDRVGVMETGFDLGYRAGSWRIVGSGDWGGALPTGYRAAAFRIRISPLER